MAEYKIVVLGNRGVGKSTLISQYDPTVEDTYKKQVDIEGCAVMLEILDVSDIYKFIPAKGEMNSKVFGFIIVYSVTDFKSFEECLSIYKHIHNIRADSKIPLVLVGNKSDNDIERCVTKEEGEKMANSFGENCKFLETSVKFKRNVDEVFEEVVKIVNKVENIQLKTEVDEERDKSKDRKKKSNCQIL